MKLRLMIAFLMITAGLQSMDPNPTAATNATQVANLVDPQTNLSIEIVRRFPRTKRGKDVIPEAKSIFIDYSSCVDESNIKNFMNFFQENITATLWTENTSSKFSIKKYQKDKDAEEIADQAKYENGASNIAIVSLQNPSNTETVNELAGKLLPHHNVIVFNANDTKYEERMPLTDQHIPVQPINMSKEQIEAAIENQAIISETMQNVSKAIERLNAAKTDKLISQTGKNILEGIGFLIEAAKKQKQTNANLSNELDDASKREQELTNKLKSAEEKRAELEREKSRLEILLTDRGTEQDKTLNDKMIFVLGEEKRLKDEVTKLKTERDTEKQKVTSLNADLVEAKEAANKAEKTVQEKFVKTMVKSGIISLPETLSAPPAASVPNTQPSPVVSSTGWSWKRYLGIGAILAAIGAAIYRYR